MTINENVNFEELARCTDEFNGAQLKAVCVEAGMIALRRGASELCHEDFMDGKSNNWEKNIYIYIFIICMICTKVKYLNKFFIVHIFKKKQVYKKLLLRRKLFYNTMLNFLILYIKYIVHHIY